MTDLATVVVDPGTHSALAAWTGPTFVGPLVVECKAFKSGPRVAAFRELFALSAKLKEAVECERAVFMAEDQFVPSKAKPGKKQRGSAKSALSVASSAAAWEVIADWFGLTVLKRRKHQEWRARFGLNRRKGKVPAVELVRRFLGLDLERRFKKARAVDAAEALLMGLDQHLRRYEARNRTTPPGLWWAMKGAQHVVNE